LNIRGFGRSGILIQGGANTISGNYLGTDATGTQLAGNQFGVWVYDSPSNLIGGNTPGSRNVISGNLANVVIQYAGSTGNKVQNNFIGVDATGTHAVGNGRYVNDYGVAVESSYNTIGTDGDGVGDDVEGNVISGHTAGSLASAWGVYMSGDHNTLAGNLIGTDVSGTSPIPNVYAVKNVGHNRIGTNGDGLSDELERNVISASIGAGIDNWGANAVIAGNYIGTDRTGTRATDPTGTLTLGNIGGILVRYASVLIGSNADGIHDEAERNVVSGNTGAGIVIYGPEVTGVTVTGNYIGTTKDGDSPLPNTQDGVCIIGSSGNTIGGTAVGAGNTIAYNFRPPDIALLGYDRLAGLYSQAET
jgi:hypothetical protein